VVRVERAVFGAFMRIDLLGVAENHLQPFNIPLKKSQCGGSILISINQPDIEKGKNPC